MRYALPEKDYLRDPVLLKGYQNLWFQTKAHVLLF